MKTWRLLVGETVGCERTWLSGIVAVPGWARSGSMHEAVLRIGLQEDYGA